MNFNGPINYAQESNLFSRVFAWMFLALSISAIPAYFIGMNAVAKNFIQQNGYVLLLLFLVQIGLVVALSFSIQKISYATALSLFLLYALTMGLTLSTIFVTFTFSSILTTFLVTASMFAAMSLYGYFTRTDLSSMGSFLIMGVIGLIIAMLVNIFFKSPAVDYVISAIGVLIFTLLTAYDVQKIKYLAQQLRGDHQSMGKIAIIGALTLYLDFINLFLFLLRLLGRQKE